MALYLGTDSLTLPPPPTPDFSLTSSHSHMGPTRCGTCLSMTQCQAGLSQKISFGNFQTCDVFLDTSYIFFYRRTRRSLLMGAVLQKKKNPVLPRSLGDLAATEPERW